MDLAQKLIGKPYARQSTVGETVQPATITDAMHVENMAAIAIKINNSKGVTVISYEEAMRLANV